MCSSVSRALTPVLGSTLPSCTSPSSLQQNNHDPPRHLPPSPQLSIHSSARSPAGKESGSNLPHTTSLRDIEAQVIPFPFHRGPAPFEKDPSLPHHRLPNTQAKGVDKTAKMVKENDTIAIIIIVLFFVLALISFGIYRLVSIARRSMSVTSGSTSSSSEIIND